MKLSKTYLLLFDFIFLGADNAIHSNQVVIVLVHFLLILILLLLVAVALLLLIGVRFVILLLAHL